MDETAFAGSGTVTVPADPDVGDRQLGHVPALDGVRGLAVLMVVIGHTQISFLPLDHAQAILDAIGGGFYGVDIFFVLSGFLITSLLLNERSARGGVWLGGFYARRALRLLPALYTLLAVYWAYSAITSAPLSPVARMSVASIFYGNNWFQIFHPLNVAPALGHIWTLSVEEQFYLVWPASLLLLLRPRRGRLLVVAICALIAVVMAHRALLWSDNGVAVWMQLVERSDTRVDSLLIGALAAVLWTRRMIPRRGLGVLAYGSIAVMAVIVGRYSLLSPFLFSGGFTLFAVATAVVIIATVQGDWVLNRFFESRPLRLLGRVSYGLYLWHQPVYFAVVRYTVSWAPLARFALALVITAGCVAASWRFVERPAQRMRHRFTERAQTSRTHRRFGATVALMIGVSVVALGMGVASALGSSPRTVVPPQSSGPLSPINTEFAALVTRSPKDFVVARSLRTAIVVNGAQYRNVDLSARVVAATLVRGGLFGQAQVVLAVSLNGRIAAVVNTTPTPLGVPDFRVVLPKRVFRSGVNRLVLFEVQGTPGAPRLARIPWSDFKPGGR